MAVWQQFFQVSELFSQNLGKNVYLPLEHGRILDILLATNIGVSIGLTMGLYYSLCGWCIQIYPDISCRSAIHWMISSHFWDGGSRICFNNSISGLAGRSPPADFEGVFTFIFFWMLISVWGSDRWLFMTVPYFSCSWFEVLQGSLCQCDVRWT